MAKDSLIIDKDYAKALDELGFCMIPLLNAEQIKSIGSVYEQFVLEKNVSGVAASHSRTSPEESLLIRNKIKDILMPSLTRTFENFDFFISGFMVKGANTSRELPLHQDWNIVDEDQYTSYQIWIPLELSYPANGGMIVLPGSHHFFQNLRSGTYDMPMINTDETVKPYVADMIIPPGDVLVYHNSLFHASYPNLSGQNRVSAIVSIYQKNAPLQYFQKNTKENKTDVYTIDPAIFLSSLGSLEKGGAPVNPISKAEQAINLIDNSKLTSIDLVQKFKAYFGTDEKGFEPIQLHLLRDGDLEKKMYRDGFVVIDLLNDKEVAALKAEYIKLFSSSHTSIGRFTPMEHTTPATKRYIHDFIIGTARPALDKYFNDYLTPIASFFTKYAKSEGNLTWHNDTSLLLNTHLEPHYGIWCPLIDVNEKNGALCAIEKSHKFSHVMFVNGLKWPYISLIPEFVRRKKIFNLKAGQAVLFDLRLIHDALPNQTDEDRICFCIRLTHTKSDYYSFVCENEEKALVSIYKEDSDYYLKDEWTNNNELINRATKVGEMPNVYDGIDYKLIETNLSLLPSISG